MKRRPSLPPSPVPQSAFRLSRRGLLCAGGAVLLLAACGAKPPKPAVVALAATGGPGMNPAPSGGGDRPVTLRLLRLRDAGGFDAAAFAALQDPAAALGPSLLGMEEVVVGPGATAAKTLTMEPEAAALGVMAMLRNPSGRTWRVTLPTPPGATVKAPLVLGPGGLTLAAS